MVTDRGARLSLVAPTPPTGARASTSASAAAWRRCWSNDRRRIELMNGLLLSMPGTPVIYYGDEIGMGDNIFLRRPRRRAHADAVVARPQRRLLRADPARLVLPPIRIRCTATRPSTSRRRRATRIRC